MVLVELLNPQACTNKKLLEAPGFAARRKDATRGSWQDYERSKKLLDHRHRRTPLAGTERAQGAADVASVDGPGPERHTGR